jgi:hypothetical protein
VQFVVSDVDVGAVFPPEAPHNGQVSGRSCDHQRSEIIDRCLIDVSTKFFEQAPYNIQMPAEGSDKHGRLTFYVCCADIGTHRLDQESKRI